MPRRRSDPLPAHICAAALRRTREIAADVLDEIKRVTPKRKPKYVKPGEPGGALKAGYTFVPTADGAVIGTDVRYWRFVEFGTAQHGDAQPHVRTGLEVVRTRRRGRR